MHHLVPLVKKHGSPSTNERAAFQHSTNQKAAIPQPTEETVTDKRQVNEDLQVWKMENGTRSKYEFFSDYVIFWTDFINPNSKIKTGNGPFHLFEI